MRRGEEGFHSGPSGPAQVEVVQDANHMGDLRLASLPGRDGMDFLLAKRQAKKLPRSFAELSVFVFGND